MKPVFLKILILLSCIVMLVSCHTTEKATTSLLNKHSEQLKPVEKEKEEAVVSDPESLKGEESSNKSTKKEESQSSPHSGSSESSTLPEIKTGASSEADPTIGTSTSKADPISPPAPEKAKYGIPETGRPGFIRSPYKRDKLIDARGILSGTEFPCPYTGKMIKMP